MRYLLLIANEPTATPPTDAEWAAMLDEHNKFASWAGEKGWLLAGGPHHTVMSTALTSTHLDHLAEILGLELALIGEGTTTRSFRQELRWNSAYHRLAGGL